MNGYIYGSPNELVLLKSNNNSIIISIIPEIPSKFAPIINNNLYHLMLLDNSGSVSNSDDMDVIAITIIIIGETIPASTDA